MAPYQGKQFAKFFCRLRGNRRYQLAHDQLINDLSAHVMDWGRMAPGDILSATSALLKYWNEAHFAIHDELLIAAATNSTAS